MPIARSTDATGIVAQALLPVDLRGRHAVVFGGTSGINLGIALAFASAGARVSVASRDQAKIENACAALRASGSEALGLRADVRDAAAVDQALRQAVEAFGAIDILVCGAAGNFLCAAKDMSSNGFRSVLDIDLVGTFNVVRGAFEHLRKPGAAVLNISAPQGAVPMRYQVHCGAAKAGIDQLTRVLALEWGSLGIRVNAISPGPVDDTEGVRRLIATTGAERALAEDAVPLKRLGTIDDIANLALFLCSPYATYVSGAVVPCDGGGALESVKPALEGAARRRLGTKSPA